jgi:hypothetical protein
MDAAIGAPAGAVGATGCTRAGNLRNLRLRVVAAALASLKQKDGTEHNDVKRHDHQKHAQRVGAAGFAAAR